MSGVEELYKHFGVLADAGDEAGNHPDVYEYILTATKGSTAEKKLACQFIPRFFKYFPALAETAIDAQLDLCEDDETPIRRQAIRSLPDFCKAADGFISKITDILTQLLQQEDAVELKIVRSGLEQLVKKDAQGALSGIFSQIAIGEDQVREKAIAFLTQLATSGTLDGIEKAGEHLLQEVRKILSDVTGEEFTCFMSILSSVKSVASNPQNLADIITEQAELDKDFQPSEIENLDRLVCCTRQALPFFSKGATPARFLEYLFGKVLPTLKEIPDSDTVNYRYELLKLITEVSVYATEDIAKQHLQSIFDILMEYLPLPSDEEIKEEVLQKLDFSSVECYMYILHKLGSKHKVFFTAEEFAESMKNFRTRLQYFGRMVQAYIKQLRVSLQATASAKLEEADNKLKVMALKTCNNIDSLVKDFLHSPPLYKSNLLVSWKSKSSPMVVASNESVEERRKRAGITPISLENLPPKKERSNEKKGALYSLPSGRKGVAMDEQYNGSSRKSYGSGRSPGRRSGGYRGGWNRNRGSGGGGGSGSFAAGSGRGRGNRQKEYEDFLKR